MSNRTMFAFSFIFRVDCWTNIRTDDSGAAFTVQSTSAGLDPTGGSLSELITTSLIKTLNIKKSLLRSFRTLEAQQQTAGNCVCANTSWQQRTGAPREDGAASPAVLDWGCRYAGGRSPESRARRTRTETATYHAEVPLSHLSSGRERSPPEERGSGN